MVSSTQQYSRIRRRKQTTNGKRNKRVLRANGTPKFPVHPEGYDPRRRTRSPRRSEALIAAASPRGSHAIATATAYVARPPAHTYASRLNPAS